MFQPADLFRAQGQPCRPEGVIQMGDLAGAQDGDHRERLVQQPGQGNLVGRGVEFFRQGGRPLLPGRAWGAEIS